MKNKLKWMMAVGMLSCSVAMAQQQSDIMSCLLYTSLVTEEKDGLLIMSHLSYTKLSEDEAVMRELSSLLVIRRNKNTGDKNEGLEN